MKALKNTRGFSLVEALVGVALLGFVVVLIGQMQTLVSTQSSIINQRIDNETIKLDVHSLVGSKTKCQGAFRSGALTLRYNGQPAAVSSLVFNNAEIARVGQESPSGVRVDSIVLQPAPGVPMAQVGNRRVYKAEMVITTSLQKGPLKGTQKNTERNKYKFYVQTDNQNEIVACAQKSVDLGPIMKSCDRQGYTEPPREVSLNGTLSKIYDYGYLPDGAIDDGGAAGGGDDAYFYCNVTGDSRFGTVSVCLSKEQCPWR